MILRSSSGLRRFKAFSKLLFCGSIVLCTNFIQSAQATIVQVQTVMGDFTVNLYDKSTPKTVENFLAYVNAGAYTNSIVHRAVPNFIVQGGGYKYASAWPPTKITSMSPVINEPVFSNKRATIAMAKLSNEVNSATNEWFINLADNSGNLDVQNGGFTVFGEVEGNGIGILESMASLNANLDPEGVPFRNRTASDIANNAPITENNVVLVKAIVVLDANVDTASKLTPAKNTLLTSSSGGGSGGGGGSINLATLLLLGCIALSLWIGRIRRVGRH